MNRHRHLCLVFFPLFLISFFFFFTSHTFSISLSTSSNIHVCRASIMLVAVFLNRSHFVNLLFVCACLAFFFVCISVLNILFCACDVWLSFSKLLPPVSYIERGANQIASVIRGLCRFRHCTNQKTWDETGPVLKLNLKKRRRKQKNHVKNK